jgi:hypothetical protein
MVYTGDTLIYGVQLDFYSNNILYAQKQLEINKNKYLLDFSKILPNTEFQLKFYSLPNDCYSCT